MRRWLCSIVVLAALAARAPSARAQRAPEPPSPATPVVVDRGEDREALKTPLAVVGGSLMLLGVGALFAAGITQLVAFGESRQLDDECPNHRCVRGTPGGDSYESARDSGKAAEVLVGVGLPLMSGGLVATLIAASLGPSRRVRAVPVVGTKGGGAHVAVSF